MLEHLELQAREHQELQAREHMKHKELQVQQVQQAREEPVAQVAQEVPEVQEVPMEQLLEQMVLKLTANQRCALSRSPAWLECSIAIFV